MARKGRDIEKIVSVLESLIDKGKVKVASPEIIKGKVSKVSREVDISLRSTVGSTNSFVMIECRDRASKESEGVDWLEQIATKARDINATKAVVVSTIPFSSGAAETAKANNIDLRILEEVSQEDITLWFSIQHMEQHIQRSHCHHLRVIINPKYKGLNLETPAPLSNYDAKIFRLKSDKTEVSWSQIWIVNGEKIFESNGIIPGAEKIRKTQSIKFGKDNTIELNTKSGWIEVDEVIMDVDLWIDLHKRSLSTIRQYKNEQNVVIAQAAEFEAEFSGKQVVFSLNKSTESGEQSVTMRIKE